MTITYIMGPSCAGKSTWAKEHAALGDVVLDYDVLATALGGSKTHDPEQGPKKVAFAARQAAEACIHDGGLDGDQFIIRSWMPPEKITDLGQKGVKFAVVDPGEATALARCADDERPAGTAERIRDWYKDRPVVPDEYLWAPPVNDEASKGAGMKTKSLEVAIKTPETGEATEGTFTGYASVFGNKDSYGDVIIPGAFTKSLKDRGPDGAGIACYWSHQMDDPHKCIGWTTKAVEDEHGLLVEVKLDLENPVAAQVHRLIKAGVVNQMSFAYEVLDYADAKSEEYGFYTELRELKIFEVSVVQVGANQETELLDVKTRLAGLKAGRKLSASNRDKLNQAVGLINAVLEDGADESASDDDDAEGSGEEQEDAKAEEPETVNAEEQTSAKSRTLSAVDIAEMEIQLMEGAH